MSQELMNAREVARYLGIARQRIYQLTKARRIPATRVTGKWLFPKRLIDEWVEATAKANLTAETERGTHGEKLTLIGG